MLAQRLVPCLDVDRGRVVKGVRFVGLRDAGDPVECAARYDEEGADELVFLDITASSDARPIVIDMVRRVADTVFLPFTVGGGVRSVDDAEELLRAGADKVAVNTAAVTDPALIGPPGRALRIAGRRAGDGRARARPAACEVYVRGGRTPTGRDAVAWAREAADRGAGEILLTSMDRDGTRDGFDVRPHARGGRRGAGARGRLRRLRRRRAHGGGADRRPRQRRPGGLDLPLRRRSASQTPSAALRAVGVEVRP